MTLSSVEALSAVWVVTEIDAGEVVGVYRECDRPRLAWDASEWATITETDAEKWGSWAPFTAEWSAPDEITVYCSDGGAWCKLRVTETELL